MDAELWAPAASDWIQGYANREYARQSATHAKKCRKRNHAACRFFTVTEFQADFIAALGRLDEEKVKGMKLVGIGQKW